MKGKEHFQFPKYCSILPLPCVIRSSQCLLSYYCCISKKDLCLKSYTISIHTTPSNDSYSKLITKTFLSHKDLPALMTQMAPIFTKSLIVWYVLKLQNPKKCDFSTPEWYVVWNKSGLFWNSQIVFGFYIFSTFSVNCDLGCAHCRRPQRTLKYKRCRSRILSFLLLFTYPGSAEHLVLILRWPLKEHQILRLLCHAISVW